MPPFDRFSAVAAVLDAPNIDTDIIFPARFLLLLDRDGLGKHAFEDRRLDRAGAEDPSFVLNQPAFRDARILVGGPNFGCGSSREHAVWALHDRGISCVVAPSFGEIFFNNCLRNAVLPIVLADAEWQRVRAHAVTAAPVTVDLPNQSIQLGDQPPIPFDIAPERREALLNGQDDIATILDQCGPAMGAFEQRRRQSHPWLFASGNNGQGN
ncbi:MAG: 3-isopropylmalate dehydratase small subunit [Methylobacterium sp.]|nr:MAG: 3-isopropylmalate dehydratase small subunit [Methylobacterium sp.]